MKGFKRIAMMHAVDGYGQAEQITIRRLAGEAAIDVEPSRLTRTPIPTSRRS